MSASMYGVHVWSHCFSGGGVDEFVNEDLGQVLELVGMSVNAGLIVIFAPVDDELLLVEQPECVPGSTTQKVIG